MGYMYTGKLVFAQLMNHLPMHSFRRCVRRYRGEHWINSFSCLDQYLCMAFAQLTYRESRSPNLAPSTSWTAAISTSPASIV